MTAAKFHEWHSCVSTWLPEDQKTLKEIKKETKNLLLGRNWKESHQQEINTANSMIYSIFSAVTLGWVASPTTEIKMRQRDQKTVVRNYFTTCIKKIVNSKADALDKKNQMEELFQEGKNAIGSISTLTQAILENCNTQKDALVDLNRAICDLHIKYMNLQQKRENPPVDRKSENEEKEIKKLKKTRSEKKLSTLARSSRSEKNTHLTRSQSTKVIKEIHKTPSRESVDETGRLFLQQTMEGRADKLSKLLHHQPLKEPIEEEETPREKFYTSEQWERFSFKEKIQAIDAMQGKKPMQTKETLLPKIRREEQKEVNDHTGLQMQVNLGELTNALQRRATIAGPEIIIQNEVTDAPQEPEGTLHHPTLNRPQGPTGRAKPTKRANTMINLRENLPSS